jgi:hypothetical protein
MYYLIIPESYDGISVRPQKIIPVLIVLFIFSVLAAIDLDNQLR